MVIIIGLGNPGEKYKNTRHNVGFIAIDKIADNFQFPIFNFQSKFNAEISQGEIAGEKVILVKPQTFMNDSGKSVRAITKPYTLDPKPLLIIIHDDIDLPVGKIKIIKERGSAGHKGVESIIKAIGNGGLIRIRIGIKPAFAKASAGKAKNIVLKKFTGDEQKLINEAIDKASDSFDILIKDGLDKAMNEYNK